MFSANSIRSAANAAASRNRLTPFQRPRLLPFGLSAFLAFLPLACSGPSDPAIVGDSPGAQPKATLQVEPASFNVTEGGTLAFRAMLGSQAVGASQLTWSVSPSSVATIDAHGVLTAVRQGEAVVTARYSSLQATARGMVRAIPQAIQALSSTSLTGIVGRSLVDSLAVRAVSSDGTPVPGVEVAFQVLSGAGSLSHAVRATGDDGVARVDWTLGTAAGQQQVRARAEHLGELVFGAEAVPDYASATVEIVAGDAQEAQVVSFLPEPLKARVVDQFGNVLPGYAVHWGFSHGGGSNQPSGSPGSTSSALSTTTDAQGMTQVFWRLGTEAGLQQALCAPSKGSSGSSANTDTNGPSLGPPDWARARGFRAKAKAAEADTVEVTPEESSTGVDQSHQLSAQVKDKYGNAIEGSSFKWTTDGSGVLAVDNTGLVYGLTVGKAEVFAEDSKSKLKGSARVNVTARVPASAQRHSGDGQTGVVGTTLPEPVAVRVLDSSGSPMQGVTVNWSVAEGPAAGAGMSGAPAASAGGPGSPSTVTNSDGRAETTWTLGTGAGQQKLRASVEGVDPVEFTATADPGAVTSIEVTPATAELKPGETRQFSATATDEFGNPVANATITWSSSNTAVATVNSDGLVTAVAAGSAEIRATSGDVTASAAITVTARAASVVQRAGGNNQTGVVATPLADPVVVRVLDNTGAPVEGVAVSWSVASGSASAGANGAAPASSAGATSSSVTVTDSDGVAQTTWTLGTSCGEHTLEASVEEVSSVAFTAEAVPGPVASIEVAPASAELEVGGTRQFTASASDEFGNPCLEAAFTWSSSNAAVATVNGAGLATAVAPGSAEIRATASEVQGHGALTITEGTIPPPPADEPPGTVTDLEVIDTSESSVTLRWTQVDDGTGNPANYAVRYGSPTISWATASATEITVEGTTTSGVMEYTYTGLEPGTAYQFRLVSYRGTLNDGATFGGLSNIAGATTETVSQEPTVVAIEVTPASAELEVGETQQFSAVATDEAGDPVSGTTFTWSSSNTAVATVSSDGLATAVAEGSAEIRATSGEVVGAAALTVQDTTEVTDPGTVTDLEVVSTTETSATLRFTEIDDGTGNPALYQIRYAPHPIGWGWGQAQPAEAGSCVAPIPGQAVGEPLECIIEMLPPDSELDFRLVAWRIGQDGYRVFSPLSNVATGTTLSAGGATGVVATLSASPKSIDFDAIGDSIEVTVVVRDSAGEVVSNTPLEWVSSNEDVASVDTGGNVVSRGIGTAVVLVTATCCSLTDSVQVAVSQALDHVSVEPVSASLQVGQSRDFTATARDRNGVAISGREFTWSSSNPGVALVNSSGTVSALAAGAAQISATTGGVEGSAEVTVSDQQGEPVPWFEERWDYLDTSDLLGQSHISSWTREGQGEINLLTGQTGTPWGGGNVVQRMGYGAGLGREGGSLTVGIDVFPLRLLGDVSANHHREIWVELYLRTDADWEILSDDKTLFFLELNIPGIGNNRWELKWGQSGYHTSAAAWPWSQHLDPPQGLQENVWNGNWHLCRWRLRMSSAPGVEDGIYEMWFNGEKLFDAHDIDTNSQAESYWNAIALGRNFDLPDGVNTSMYFGRLRVYTENPGW